MKTPTEVQVEQLAHMYDPVYAREYYLRTRKLKGRKKANPNANVSTDPNKPMYTSKTRDPRKGKTRVQISKDARAKQRKELSEQVANLERKLKQLEAKIKEKEREEASEDRKGKAKKERAAKERDKPKSAAEKAEIARENKKYREKNQQKLKNEAKKDSTKSKSDSSSKSTGSSSGRSVSELKTLATKVRGQIAVAKQKLAAL